MTGHNIVIMTDNCSFLFLLEAGAGGNNQYWMNCICFLDKSQNFKTQAILLRVITMKIEGYIELCYYLKDDENISIPFHIHVYRINMRKP